MQEDAELMDPRVSVELRAADVADLAGQPLALALVVVVHGGLVLARHDLLDDGRVRAWRDGRHGRKMRAVACGCCVRDFCLAHLGQPVDDLAVALGGGFVAAEVRPEDSSVGVDRVVGDRVAEELQVHADLVRAPRQREAVHDAVAFGFVGEERRRRGGPVAAGGHLVLVGFRGGGGRRVVRQPAELGLCVFAGGAHAVEPELGTDGHDGLVADDHAVWESALDARDVFLLHGALLQLDGDGVRAFGVLRDEHHPGGQAVEPVAGPWDEFLPAL